MKKTRLALIGAAGYGAYYLSLLENHVNPDFYELCGVIDPFADKSPRLEWLRERKIPIYDTVADFFAADSAELVCVSSPIPLHEEQCREIFANGSHVLCEKPISATVQSALRMRESAESAGKPLAIGFQWSFCRTMRSLKADILAGKFGAPKRFRTFLSWLRGDSYYVGSWHGNLRTRGGGYILDSVASNATAHYLHNMFFLLGDAPDSAATPDFVEAELYRAKQIESFDTCFMRGRAAGTEFWFGATHAGDSEINPRFVYEFEDADVIYDQDKSPDVVARFRDGREINYGDPQCDDSTAEKLRFMLSYAAGESAEEPPCTVDTALPHLRVCNMALDTVRIAELPSELRFREKDADRVRGLVGGAISCWDSCAMPREKSLPWAVSEGGSFSPAGYDEFTGKLV